MSQPSSHADAKQKLSDLDRRYRELLDETDRIQDLGGDAIDDFQPSIKARFIQVIQDVEAIQIEFPSLLASLEAKYRTACRGQMVGAKSQWPKRDFSSLEFPSADDLVNFAFEEGLTLEGEPH